MIKHLVNGELNTPPELYVKNDSTSGYHYVGEMYKQNPASHNLPTGYTEVEYLEGSGTQYINTNYIGNINTKVLITYQLTEITSVNQILLSMANVIPRYSVYIGDGGATFNECHTYRSGITEYLSGEHTPKVSANITDVQTFGFNIKTSYFYAYNQEFKSRETMIAPTSNWLIFSNNGSNECGHAKIYSVKFWESNNLVHNFIPVKRNSDSVIGMYDIVSQTFFTNAGTGTFTAGPEVEPYQHVFSAGYDTTVTGNPATMAVARAKPISYSIAGNSKRTITIDGTTYDVPSGYTLLDNAGSTATAYYCKRNSDSATGTIDLTTGTFTASTFTAGNELPTPDAPLGVAGVGDYDSTAQSYKFPLLLNNTTTYNIYDDAQLFKVGDYADNIASTGVRTNNIKKVTLSEGTHTLSDAVTNGPYLCTQQASGILTGQVLTLDTGVTDADVYYALATATTETVTAPAISTVKGTNYLQCTTTLAPSQLQATYRKKWKTIPFQFATWAEIKAACQSGDCATMWKVGDRKTITATDGRTYTIRIADMTANRYAYSDGSRSSHAVFEFVELLNNNGTTIWRMNKTSSNTGGWAAMPLKTTLQGFTSLLPTDLSSILEEVNILSLDKVDSTSVSLSANTLFLPCRYEISTGSTTAYLNEAPAGIWQYYSTHNTNAGRIKYRAGASTASTYWTRSANYSTSTDFSYVNTSGSISDTGAINSRGLAPCFAF